MELNYNEIYIFFYKLRKHVYLICNKLYLHFPTSLSVLTLWIGFVTYSPIQFINDFLIVQLLKII